MCVRTLPFTYILRQFPMGYRPLTCSAGSANVAFVQRSRVQSIPPPHIHCLTPPTACIIAARPSLQLGPRFPKPPSKGQGLLTSSARVQCKGQLNGPMCMSFRREMPFRYTGRQQSSLLQTWEKRSSHWRRSCLHFQLLHFVILTVPRIHHHLLSLDHARRSVWCSRRALSYLHLIRCASVGGSEYGGRPIGGGTVGNGLVP